MWQFIQSTAVWFIYGMGITVLGLLGYAIYIDVKDGTAEERLKKKREYLLIALGGMVLLILLKTVWAEPLQSISTAIDQFQNRHY